MNTSLLVCTVTLSLGLMAAAPSRAQTADPAPAATSPAAISVPAVDATAEKPKMTGKTDTGKNGAMTPEEKAAKKKARAARKAKKLKKYDKNGDGKLDETEKATMRADRQANKEQ